MPRKKSVPVKSLESSDAKVAMGVTHQTPKFIPTITPPITNSNDKKDEHNKKVNDIGTETRQQSAYGRAVYKKNDGSPEGYRVPIRPSNTYTMERSGTRQRRPGRIIQNSK